jgi:hypothetical protein
MNYFLRLLAKINIYLKLVHNNSDLKIRLVGIQEH